MDPCPLPQHSIRCVTCARAVLALIVLVQVSFSSASASPGVRLTKRHLGQRGLHAAKAEQRNKIQKWLGDEVVTGQTLRKGHSGFKGCPLGCTDRGVCNLELGRCDCQRGWHGPDCSIAPTPVQMARTCLDMKFFRFKDNCTDSNAVSDPNMFCVNNCNGRGRCRAGWCHCEPGYWGMDCSLSMGPDGKTKILAGMGYKLRQKRPSIYVYDLPHRLTTWINPTYSDRPLHVHFYQRLLAAGVLTSNPAQADYFLFPMLLRKPSDGVLLEAAIDYVKEYWPYWDKFQGRRHLVIHTGDMGRAELTGQTQQLLRNTTMLTHWGLTKTIPEYGWKASHIENQDIVIPVYISPMGGRGSGLQASPLHPNSSLHGSDNKDIQLLFAGRICGGRENPDGTKDPNCRPINVGYSQNVRQRVHQHHWNRTGFVINVTVPNYFDKLTRTRFCLAPSGGGHGHRQILVAYSGCTPLVISDNVLQPFEPALNWSRFGVTLPEAAIPELHTLLPSISKTRYNQLQAALPCAAQHMAWSSVGGAFMKESGKYDAFETTLEILRVMLKHPEVPHNQFETIDPEFKAFMECRSDAYFAAQKAALTGEASRSMLAKVETSTVTPGSKQPRGDSGALCSVSKWDGKSCESCMQKWRRVVPGGALCCHSTGNLAQCPRLWD